MSLLLAVIERLGKRGYELYQNDALAIMKLFTDNGLFKKSTGSNELCWYNDEEFATEVKKIPMLSCKSAEGPLQLLVLASIAKVLEDLCNSMVKASHRGYVTLGGRSIENSSTSSEKVVAGSIFIHGCNSVASRGRENSTRLKNSLHNFTETTEKVANNCSRVEGLLQTWVLRLGLNEDENQPTSSTSSENSPIAGSGIIPGCSRRLPKTHSQRGKKRRGGRGRIRFLWFRNVDVNDIICEQKKHGEEEERRRITTNRGAQGAGPGT
ncbi:unnamed protein product [Trichogramma brassicae]|uniref:Uncharacterized protein n=1 Tax=Trichogramma brassicae TaxID=86971 RepID=A0A6H5IEG9_9HYME|nr:unnamed protein product [Trichogramma brassicae]